jgi:hypothetical protein
MKNLLTVLVAFATFSISAFGQSPEGFNYQAAIRNASNAIVSNQSVGLRMTLQQGVIGGATVYSETFAVTTNTNGLVNVQIGNGSVLSGTFATINWANGPFFIETAVDATGGSSYVVMGTSQLMSVPFALYAKTSGNGQGPVGPQGPAGAPGATGSQGPVGPAGQGGVTTAGADIAIAGAGTTANPYVVSSRTYTIGLWPELGGYVFWVSADGKHGLVAETQNQANGPSWYSAQDLISNPSTHSVNGQKFRDWRRQQDTN